MHSPEDDGDIHCFFYFVSEPDRPGIIIRYHRKGNQVRVMRLKLCDDVVRIIEEPLEHPVLEEGVIEELGIEAQRAPVAGLFEDGGKVLYGERFTG
jgi:hypothetical protein